MSINTMTERCWRIVLPTGEDYDGGDGVPHFDTEADARSNIGVLAMDPDVTIVQFDTPCVTVACEECEEDPGAGDVFSELHCPDVEEARKLALASDWKVTQDGKTYCWDCPVPEQETADA